MQEGICRQQKKHLNPAVSYGPMPPHQDPAGTHGKQTLPQAEVTVGETQLTRVLSPDSGRMKAKAPMAQVLLPLRTVGLNTSTWQTFSPCQMHRLQNMCSGNTGTTVVSGDALLGNLSGVSAAMCATLSRDVEKAEAGTRVMALGTEDDDRLSSLKMTSEHISVPEEKEPEKAQEKDTEENAILGAETDKL